MQLAVKCDNCGHINKFDESELVGEVPLVTDDGRVISRNNPVKVNENTFIQCEKCKYPVSCKNLV